MRTRLKKRPAVPLLDTPLPLLADGAILRKDPVREALVKTRATPIAGLVPQSQALIDQRDKVDTPAIEAARRPLPSQ